MEARQYAESALDTVSGIMKDKKASHSSKLRAAEILLDKAAPKDNIGLQVIVGLSNEKLLELADRIIKAQTRGLEPSNGATE